MICFFRYGLPFVRHSNVRFNVEHLAPCYRKGFADSEQQRRVWLNIEHLAP